MSNPAKILVTQAAAGQAISAVGDNYRFLATGAETSGAYALCEALIFPKGGPPPHWHDREEESFYILDGEIIFTVEGKEVVATPGTFLQVPRGVVHTFRNATERKARMLVQTSPAGFEAFMAEIGRPVPSLEADPLPVQKADIDRLLATAPKFGIHLVPPPA